MNHTRNGKIARLPSEIREQLNQSILDGMEYPRIIDWLTQLGHPGVNPVNLTNWRSGGYEDWLRHRERLEELELKLEYAGEVALQADPVRFQQATLNLTCLQFFELLNRFDPGTLVTSLHSKPEKYPSLINSFARFTREFVGLQRFRTDREDKAKAEAKAEARNKDSADKEGIQTETAFNMLAEMRMRFPDQYQALTESASASDSVVAASEADANHAAPEADVKLN